MYPAINAIHSRSPACLVPETDRGFRNRIKASGIAKRLATALLFGAASCTGSESAAQIVPDAAVPATQQAMIGADGMGHPLVNIQTPSAAGVSRNVFSRFDVRGDGVILNNSRDRNPLLGGREASVILNEVNSSKPSQLQGPVVVDGARAHVVIANPSGLRIDGARFINASRVTLTTGTPIVENGEFRRLEVRQGAVEIGGKGLDAGSVPFTEILGRAARIASRIDARKLHVVTGAQDFDPVDGTTKPAMGTGEIPEVAIDTVALGGMHAGSIVLMATEAGVGVRNAGTLWAHGEHGSLSIRSGGRLENTGDLKASADVLLSATGLTLSGRGLRAGGRVDVEIDGDMRIEARVAGDGSPGVGVGTGEALRISGSDIRLRASGDIMLEGLHAHGAGRLLMHAGRNLTVDGSIASEPQAGEPAGGRRIDGESNHCDRGPRQLMPTVLSGAGGVTLEAGADLSLSGVDVRAGQGTARLRAQGDVVLATAREWSRQEVASEHNEPGIISFADTQQTVTHRRSTQVTRPVTVHGDDVEIEAGSDIHVSAAQLVAERRLTLEAGGDLNYLAVPVRTESISDSRTGSRLFGVDYHRVSLAERVDTTIEKPVRLHAGTEVLSRSGGNQVLQGTEVVHGERAVFLAGTGLHANADARLVFSAARSSRSEQRLSGSDLVFWSAEADHGNVVETTAMPGFDGPATVTFQAPGGLQVQVPAGHESTMQSEGVGNQRWTGYLRDFAQREDVAWEELEAGGSAWSRSRRGMTPAGTALLTSGAFWGTAGLGGALTGFMPGSVAGRASNMAFSRFASLGAIALVNSGGNLASVLADLASASTMRATAAAGLTAGLLAGLGRQPSAAKLKSSPWVHDRFAFYLASVGGRMLVQATINGGNPAPNAVLSEATFLTMQDTFGGLISDARLTHGLGEFGYALAGCASGSAGHGSCVSGALGNAAVDVASGVLAGQRPGSGQTPAARLAYETRLLGLSKAVAGVVAAYGGGNVTEAMYAAEAVGRLRGLR